MDRLVTLAPRPARRRVIQGSLGLAVAMLMSGCGVLALPGSPSVRVYRLGLFHVGLDHVPPSLQTVRDGLAALGYEEGKNLDLDWRNLPDEEAARVTALEFVRNRVDLIVAFENQTIRAAKAATSEIPIVMLHGADPVVYGWVESFAHPGGNVTGYVGQPDLPDKRLEFFKAVAPDLRTLLVLVDLEDPTNRTTLPVVHRTATLLNVDLLEQTATSAADLEHVFNTLRPGDAQGIFVASQNLLVKHQALILKLGLEKRMPLMSQRKEWVEQGALVSYGPNLAATGHAAASHYIDKILRGTKPGDLPIEQADHLELVINMRTAKSLGIEIPQALLAQADAIVQ